MTLAVVIPVLNEEAAIGDVVRATLAAAVTREVLVVDGGSRDATATVAEAAGATVVLERRPGYGWACATGVAATQADVVAFLDGDGSDDASTLGLLVAPVLHGYADLTLGVRRPREHGALPWQATLGNVVAAFVISQAWRQRVTDLPSFKVIRRQALLDLRMQEMTYGWTVEMIVKAARQGYRIEEIAVPYRRRAGGQSKVSGNIGASAKAAWSIMGTLARYGFSRRS